MLGMGTIGGLDESMTDILTVPTRFLQEWEAEYLTYKKDMLT